MICLNVLWVKIFFKWLPWLRRLGLKRLWSPAVRKDRTLPSNVWFCSCLRQRDDSRPGILFAGEGRVSNDWLIFILELFLNCTVVSINHELCGLSYHCSVAKSCLTLWTPWTVARQAPVSFTISQSLCKFMSVESVMPSNHLILCFPLFLLPSVFPSIRVFPNELVLCIRWPK